MKNKIYQNHCDQCSGKPYDLCVHIETKKVDVLCKSCSDKSKINPFLEEKTKYYDISLLKDLAETVMNNKYGHTRNNYEIQEEAKKLKDMTLRIVKDDNEEWLSGIEKMLFEED